MKTGQSAFQQALYDLMRWRRDVRRFRTDPVDEAALTRCLEAFRLSPSVGLSEPWRLVRVESSAARAACLDNYRNANAAALSNYTDEKAHAYSALKLSGMAEAPIQLAVFSDEATTKGSGLGAASMPETRAYSVVSAITLFWLALRAEGLGLGWVSVLDPARLCRDLNVPPEWKLVGYLCIGWPETEGEQPELEQLGWECRAPDLRMESR